jgi:hypothetical protein
MSRESTSTSIPVPPDVQSLARSVKRFLNSNGIEATETQIYLGLCILCSVVFFMAIKLIASLISYALYALVILFCALALTIPPKDSFDAKKELKRVIRGENLPPGENHVNLENKKGIKGFFERAFIRAEASVTGEILSLAGHEVTIDTYAVVHISRVNYSVTNSTCVWVGCFNKWYFIGNFGNEDKKRN